MSQVALVYKSTVGKKYLMAITGMIGVGFVIGHMLGNLQAFPFLGGAERFNAYARKLRELGPLLQLARAVLLVSVITHIVVAYQLARQSWAGRPIDYALWRARGSDYASRTMRWSGPILALFILYHLAHFTWGTVHHHFIPGDVHANLVSGFQVWYISLLYIAAMGTLGFHIYHGIWSMFQSLGLNNPKVNETIRRIAVFLTMVITAGYISIPVAVLAGYIR